jgi:regulator of sigma E protease
MNTSILGGLTFVLVFAGIILVHELGHFVAARLFGIEVEEFGFGFPPRIVKLFRWRGTDFTLNWIPLGGFNKIKGEDDPNSLGGLAAANPWKRIVVLAAGAAMNLLTAVVGYTIYFSQIGIPDLKAAAVGAVDAGSPADQAGLRAGDIIVSAAGTQITSYDQVLTITRQHLDQPLVLEILRSGQSLEVTVTPRSNPPEGQGPMGIMIGNPLYPASSWFATVPPSLSAVGRDITSLLALPGRLIAGTATPQEAQVAGPRTIWNLFQESVSRDVQSRQPAASGTGAQPTNYTLSIIIMLAISVGVINLMPIPALDGGRIFMALTEIILRKRIPTKYQMAINGIGFMVLLALLGTFYIKDLINPIVINLP